MNDHQKEKIQRFLNDKVMSQAVYDVLLDSFLKEKSNDVYFLAASRLSVDSLKRGWGELQKHMLDIEREQPSQRNVGV